MSHRTSRARPFANPYEYFTPFDNLALDEIMPRLSANGWKILCIAVRQTWGYYDPTSPTGRKESDQISYSQFMEKAGIGSKTTISRAISENLDAGYLLRWQCGTDPRSGLPLYAYSLNTDYELGGTEDGPQASSPENGPHSGTESGPLSSPETVPTKESKERVNKRAPGGAGADAPAAPAAPLPGTEMYQGNAPIVVHHPDDVTFLCPVCQEQVSWPSGKTNFTCSNCGQALAGYELGNPHDRTPDWRPPRGHTQKEERVLGNLVGDCPAPLKPYPYFARDRVALLGIHGMNKALLWEEIRFQAGKNLTNQCPRQQVVHNGLVATQNKLPMATRPKEENESQAERNAREATPVSEELSGVFERVLARSREEN